MTGERSMATRTIQHYSGDVGEVEVLKELLLLGAAVNGLTASDYGWDLHVHAPSDVMDLDESIAPLPRTWGLSGRTAHVQVKRSAKNSPPRVSVGTARGWLTGTRAGTPTFLLLVSGGRTKSSEPQVRYATPNDISSWLQTAEKKHGSRVDSGTYTFGSRQAKPFDRRRFAAELQLWTRYPNVMLHPDLPDIVPFLISSTVDLTPSVVLDVIRGFALGYCAHFQLPIFEDINTETRDAINAFTNLAQIPEEQPDNTFIELYQYIDATVMKADSKRAPAGGIPLGAYTVSTDKKEALADALECICWLLGLRGKPEQSPTSSKKQLRA